MGQLNLTLNRDIASLQFVVFDFDGVFTDNHVTINEEGLEGVRCWRGDGIGLRKLDAVRVEYMILSSETSPVVADRAKKLAIPCFHGCKDKISVLRETFLKKNISPENSAYVGNDINDLECMKSVGVPVAVSDAYPEIVAVARYVTDLRGGYGAVREVCDLVYNAKIESKAGAD